MGILGYSRSLTDLLSIPLHSSTSITYNQLIFAFQYFPSACPRTRPDCDIRQDGGSVNLDSEPRAVTKVMHARISAYYKVQDSSPGYERDQVEPRDPKTRNLITRIAKQEPPGKLTYSATYMDVGGPAQAFKL
jgi:hypothetical protein